MNALKTSTALAVAALLAACPEPVPSNPADAGQGGGGVDGGGSSSSSGGVDAGPPIRTVAEGVPLHGDTPVQNLLIDPLFNGQYVSSLAFFPLVFDDSGNMQGTFAVQSMRATPSRTPASAAFGDNGGYTAQVGMLTGGTGPFHVEVWATVRDDAGTTPTAGDITVEIGAAWPADSSTQKWTVPNVAADTVEVGGRSWLHYVAKIEDNLPMTSVFVVTSTGTGKDLFLAGPQVVPVSLLPPLPPSAARRPVAVKGTWNERARTVLRYAWEKRPQLDKPADLRPVDAQFPRRPVAR